MERSIQNLSQPTDIVVKNKKPKLPKRYIIIPIAVLLVIWKIIVHVIWLDYYEKYYVHFLEFNQIAEGSEDGVSSWGYKDFEKDGFIATIEYHKPATDKFQIGIGLTTLIDTYGTSYWTLPDDDYHYRPELNAGIRWNGDVEYYGSVDIYSSSDRELAICPFLIDKNGKLILDSSGMPEKTEEQRQVIYKFQDKIFELKETIEKDIIDLR